MLDNGTAADAIMISDACQPPNEPRIERVIDRDSPLLRLDSLAKKEITAVARSDLRRNGGLLQRCITSGIAFHGRVAIDDELFVTHGFGHVLRSANGALADVDFLRRVGLFADLHFFA